MIPLPTSASQERPLVCYEQGLRMRVVAHKQEHCCRSLQICQENQKGKEQACWRAKEIKPKSCEQNEHSQGRAQEGAA